MIDQALDGTAELWPEVQLGFELVHGAAGILENKTQKNGAGMRRAYATYVQKMSGKMPQRGALHEAFEHFQKVTDSYWPGLFHCYDVPDLPRTNNDLEQCFGATRCHERRCTGRQRASSSAVVQGQVRIVACLGTRQQTYTGGDLAPAKIADWRTLRASLAHRRHSRALRCRFRRKPADYLRALESILLQQAMPR